MCVVYCGLCVVCGSLFAIFDAVGVRLVYAVRCTVCCLYAVHCLLCIIYGLVA